MIISPFVIYHFVSRSESLKIYGKIDQNPAPTDKLLTPLKGKNTVRILSLEGKGAKAIVSAKVLDYIEKQSGKPISELFDIIMGTSLGSVSSVILTAPDQDGNIKYKASDLVDLYNNHMNEFFDAPLYHKILTLNGLLGPKFKIGPRYRLLDQYIDGLYFDQLKTNVVIPAYNMYQKSPEVFYNWDVSGQQDMNFTCLDLTMGAISPYSIFPHYSFSSKSKRFALADGSIFMKSPDLAAALIGINAYPNKNYVLVSIGSEILDSQKEGGPSGDFSLLSNLLNYSDLEDDASKKFSTYILREQFPFRVEVYNFAIPRDKIYDQEDGFSKNQINRLNVDADELIESKKEALNALVQKLVKP